MKHFRVTSATLYFLQLCMVEYQKICNWKCQLQNYFSLRKEEFGRIHSLENLVISHRKSFTVQGDFGLEVDNIQCQEIVLWLNNLKYFWFLKSLSTWLMRFVPQCFTLWMCFPYIQIWIHICISAYIETINVQVQLINPIKCAQ